MCLLRYKAKKTNLKLVRLNILPQCADNNGSGLPFHAEQTTETSVKLELKRLMIQQEQNRAAHVFVSGTLHLDRQFVWFRFYL